MSFKTWKWQKWQNSEVNSQFYPLIMLLVLSAKYFTRALSERKENFASASWAPLSYWKVSAELSAARDFDQWAQVERRSIFVTELMLRSEDKECARAKCSAPSDAIGLYLVAVNFIIL